MDVSGILSSTVDARAAVMQAQNSNTDFDNFRALFEQMIEQGNTLEAAERAQIRQAAEMFESYFLNLMFRNMRSLNFDEDGFIPRGNAERIFTEMLDEAISDQAAAQGGFGLADMIYAQMTRQFDSDIIRPRE
jgi:flagellar protein FlgJ